MTANPNPATTGGGHRLFFALWPTDDVRVALGRATHGVEMFVGAGRRTASEKHHLTLHFLGGWPAPPDDVIEQACDAAATVRADALRLVIDHAGGFAAARVGWLAPSANAGLEALWASLGRALDDAGIRYRSHERFTPHVTVLRNVRGRLAEVAIDPVPWSVHDFVLVHSHDGCYDIVDRWPLQP
ncbi:RNA 2',3'-cyclic phosphodiesterase [Lysobacter sp. TY2-98]|uniref:RNA 2',3'-cyclic phosphodiesterase n=1 Tax=Lysobacter sp. TY2-98 TaxID=2290922 RepID=UPI000E1FEF19|nr:RNA 2',3'-cyclic phosphodiesterase [Lysobacter sp. TY2-98]AXK72050.1 RNA 2',3'-cyclic phosphodiesterase [Lysobacter sp. TY2-98]